MGWRRFVARHHRSLWARGLAKASRTYLHAWQNLDYDLDHNGEREVLRRLRPVDGAVLLDVGANEGDWSRIARAEQPGTTVHAFEIVPSTVASLRARVAGDPGIVVHPHGLADVDGSVEVWVPLRSSRGASIVHSEVLGREVTRVEAPIRRGIGVLDELGRPPVALLKVDVEGATLAVLRGLEPALADGTIEVVQFEWNEWTVEAGSTLRDHHLLLDGAGFAVGRLHPDGAVFAPYRPAEERAAPGTYLAVRRDRPATLDALSSPPPRRRPARRRP